MRLRFGFVSRWAPLALVASLAGCATAPLVPSSGLAELERCREVFRRVDETIGAHGVADGGAARVAGFPYLRVNRFLASYAAEDLDAVRFAEWMDRLIALGREGYAVELANLPIEAKEALAHELWELDARYAWPASAIAHCTERLAAADRADAGRRQELKRAARVPDEYRTWQRVLGLYWITRVPFAAGVRGWQNGVRETFAQPLEALPVAGALRVYAPPPGRLSASEVAAILGRSSHNALAIPEPRGEALEALYRTFAPEFVVDTAGEADLPGELGWAGGAAPRVVSHRPVVYRRLSHTRYCGRVLLQLNYSIWFPQRPKSAGWDILGGHLDGVLWRVTLAPDGAPWVFDTMHLCGCYHQFFPTARATVKPQPDTLEETAFVPQSLPRVEAGAVLAVRLASGTHYVQRVVAGAGPSPQAIEYAFEEDDVLRSLPLPNGGRRSAFRPDGIVPGSERDERYFFWPMGVPAPGAMRQWGRHATAFVGRRHFDDPWLFERYFTLEKP